jgi:hypothetical protein
LLQGFRDAGRQDGIAKQRKKRTDPESAGSPLRGGPTGIFRLSPAAWKRCCASPRTPVEPPGLLWLRAIGPKRKMSLARPLRACSLWGRRIHVVKIRIVLAQRRSDAAERRNAGRGDLPVCIVAYLAFFGRSVAFGARFRIDRPPAESFLADPRTGVEPVGPAGSPVCSRSRRRSSRAQE